MRGVRVYNAAGPKSKEFTDLKKLLQTPVPVIHIGSISEKPSTGNAEKKWWTHTDGTTLNSFGLPNKGLAYYEQYLPSFLEKAHAYNKKLRVSIVGSTPKEFGRIAKRLMFLGVDEIEVNAGCPNVWKGLKQKEIPAFNAELLEAILEEVTKQSGNSRIDIKLSPYSNPGELQKVAELLGKQKRIAGVVLSNTFPNAFSKTTGLAGLGGTAFHHLVLGQVYQFRRYLPKDFTIVGLGGVHDAAGIKRFAQAGANEVQIGSHYFTSGPKVFDELT